MATWISSGNSPLGFSRPGSVDDTATAPIGTVAKFRDALLGEGEFIYLKGAASTLLGTPVTYRPSTGAAQDGTTTHVAASMLNSAKPVAFATAAILASNWGWYQIGGAAVTRITGTVATGDDLFIGAGLLTATPGAGLQVLGLQAGSANGVPAANEAIVTIDRPHIQGQIT